MIIDIRYFVDTCAIPGLNTIGSGISADMRASVERIIVDKEPEYVEMLFGLDYATVPNELKALLYNEESLRSPIANYCYVEYMGQMATRTTIAGEKKLNSEQSSNVDSNAKMARAWNDMVTRSFTALRNAILLGYSVETPDSLSNDNSMLYYYLNVEQPTYDANKIIYPNEDRPIFHLISNFGI